MIGIKKFSKCILPNIIKNENEVGIMKKTIKMLAICLVIGLLIIQTVSAFSIGLFFLDLMPAWLKNIIAPKEEFGSISGTVTPADTSILVQAIQNGSLVKQVNVNEDGSYNITGLEPGRYGLLFVRVDKVYIYHKEVMQVDWFENDTLQLDRIEVIEINKNESKSDLNINFERKTPDYVAKKVVIKFDSSFDKKKIEEILRPYYDEIIEIRKYYGSDDWYCTIKIKQDKTVLDVVNELTSKLKLRAYPMLVGYGA